MYYSRILSFVALVIITTSPCGWVKLLLVLTVPQVIVLAGSQLNVDSHKREAGGETCTCKGCWTCWWEKELTLPEVIQCFIVLFSHKLSSY
jgi:hypothetical protein